MDTNRWSRKSWASLLLAASAFAANLDCAAAADRRVGGYGNGNGNGVFITESTDVQRVKVTVHKSRTFRVETPFATVVAGSPEIVDVRSLSDHVIYVQGKQTGTTN